MSLKIVLKVGIWLNGRLRKLPSVPVKVDVIVLHHHGRRPHGGTM